MPEKIQNLIDDGDNLIDANEKKFLKSVKDAEETLYKEIIKLFEVVDITNGKLKNSDKAKAFLLSLDKRITDALYNSPYRSGVSGLLKSFDSIAQNNIDLQSALNGKNIAFSQINGIKQIEANNTLDRLMGNGINNNFIAPIRETLYRNILVGSTVDETQAAIKDYIISTPEKDSKLLRYADQIGRDSVMQFDGAVQQNIGSELGLTDYVYTGSIIIDSRGQCIHWANKVYLKGSDLKNEIDKALNNKWLGGKRCSGMNPSCTVSTFSIYRGGYRCRHRAIATLI